MPEVIHEADSIEMKETPEVPQALMRWINRNRVTIQRLLDRSAGDVPLQISTVAMNECNLDHQWVRIGQHSPHEIRSGEKILTTLDATQPALTVTDDAMTESLSYAAAS